MTTDGLIGQVIGGRYVVEEKVGVGGFGVVYRAIHHELGRNTALKFVPSDAPPVVVARLRREARLLAGLRHPAIVTVHDFGITDGRVWLAQEYVQGHSLAQVMGSGAPLPPERVTDIALGVLEGLIAAHEAGIVHRDIKPANLMLTPGPRGEEVRVLDFGIARILAPQGDTLLTQDRSILGTPLYIAPEQARNEDIGPQTDLYALGAVMYHMLAGRPPFQTSDPLSTVIQHIQAPVPPLSDAVPRELAEILYRALEKHPADRFVDAEAMADALRRSRVPPQPPAELDRRSLAPFLWALGVASGLMCISGFGVWLFVSVPHGNAVARSTSASGSIAGDSPAPPGIEHATAATVATAAPLDATPADSAPAGSASAGSAPAGSAPADSGLRATPTSPPDARSTDGDPSDRGPSATRADSALADSGLSANAITANAVTDGELPTPRATDTVSPAPARTRETDGGAPPSMTRRRPRFSRASIERDLDRCRCDQARKKLVIAGDRAAKWEASVRRDIEVLMSEHRQRCLFVGGVCFGRGR